MTIRFIWVSYTPTLTFTLWSMFSHSTGQALSPAYGRQVSRKRGYIKDMLFHDR
jgi:hypothetical protein